MEGPPRSTKRCERINKQQVANHVTSMVEELQETTHVIEISTESTAHIERSMFYCDDVKRVYQLNPKEHPGLIGVLDTILTGVKTRTGIDLTRTTASEGYLLSITTSDESSLGESNITENELREHGVYSAALTTAITTQPFEPYNTSFTAGVENELCLVEETTSPCYSPCLNDVVHEIPLSDCFTDINCSEVVFEKATACDKMVLTKTHMNSTLAKLIAIINSTAFLREDPLVNDTVANQKSFNPQHNTLCIGTNDKLMLDKKRDEFLLETAPGWRLRWIVETISTDSKPLENISNAANISIEEAEITLSLMSQWWIVTENVSNGEKCYKLTASYQKWKDEVPNAGFQITEPSYIVDTSSPKTIINDSFEVFSESLSPTHGMNAGASSLY